MKLNFTYLFIFLGITIYGCKNSNTIKNQLVDDVAYNVGHKADSCSSEGILVKRNKIYNDNFTRFGNGWTGGDATYSIAMDRTTNLWIFGDTFLGTVKKDRSRDPSALIHNTLVLEKNGKFSTFYGGTTETPDAYLKPPEKDWWYWPGHGQIHDNTIQLIMFAITPIGEGGGWQFEYAAIDIVTLSIPDLKVISTKRKMLFDGTNYGASFLQLNGYTYIYGSRKEGEASEKKHLRIARVKGTDLHKDWEFYKGNNLWTENATESIDAFSNVSDQFSIIKRNSGFYLITQHHRLQPLIYLYEGDLPVGPFKNQKTLYCTPERKDMIFTYNAFVHEQFSTEDTLFISYNNNSFTLGDLNNNADNYRPHFINVIGWNKK